MTDVTNADVGDDLPDNGTPNLAELAETPAAEPVAETPPEPEAEPEPKPEEPTKPKPQSWEQRRINELTKARREAERQRDAALALVEAARKPADPDAPPEPAPAALPQSEIERRAEQIAAQREYQRQVEKTIQAGATEFSDFNANCNVLADLGANERPEFMQIVTDVDGGHKVLQHLGQNPEEADRILHLPPHKMAMEIARIADKVTKPAPVPVSRAPAPITPIDGNARVVKDPDQMSDDEWFEWRQKQKADKRSGRR